MKKNKVNNYKLTSFSEHLGEQYGKPGTTKCESYEHEYKAFKYDVLKRELKEKQK
jgi:HTH-type transcriptional regulator/antitoxin HipB